MIDLANHFARQRGVAQRCKFIKIEPIIAAGSGQGVLAGDHWTIHTADGSLSAHYEHLLVITKGSPILLTAA